METSVDDDVIASLSVPVKASINGMLTLNFVNVNNFALLNQKKRDVTDNLKENIAAACTVNIVEQRCILFDSEVRKLVNESSGTFLSSRSVPSSVDDIRSYYLSLSHEHRSSIRQCIENLQLKKESAPEYEEWIEMFDNIEIVWHLCELLHMDILVGAHVVGPLVEWVRFHCCEIELRASSILMEQNTQISTNDDYWDVVTGLLLQARFEATRALLKLHSQSYTTPFLEADNILVNIPIFAANCGLSINEFMSKWRSWKASVKVKINSGLFNQHPKLLEIMEIVSGESGNLLKKLKVYCDTWYQLLSASLVFLDPTARLTDLPYYSRLCIAEYGGPQAMKVLDHTIHAIFEADLNKVISKLELSADGGWAAIHLSNLLQLFGVFSNIESEHPCVEVESLIIDYAVLLCGDRGLWTTGVSYLEQCGPLGKATLEEILGALPLDSEQKAYRIIDVARNNNLIPCVNKVARWMGNKFLSEGKLNQALQWSLESEDPELMSQVAQAYLWKLSQDLTYPTQSLLYLGTSTNPSERLTFLAQYAKYIDLTANKKAADAASLLVNLIDNKVIPKFFYGRLLNDVLAILSMNDATNLIDSNQALVILEAVEELSSDSQLSSIQILRCREAIAFHLATTLISDITISTQDSGVIDLSNII